MMKLTDTQHYSDIADAIRAKTGGSGTMTPAEMPTEIANIPSGGGGMDEDFAALLAGTATGEIDITIPEMHGGGFVFNTGINSGVTKLTLRGVKKLGEVSYGLGGLCVGSANLTDIILPECEELSIYRRMNSSSSTWRYLRNLNAPKLKAIGQNAFNYANHLESITLSSVESIDGSAFVRCIFTTADFPKLSQIGSNAFQNCANLTALILRNSTVCTLGNVAALSSTPIASGTGYIYVPRALVDTYKAATNWTTYAAQFRAIEDYTSDGTITGEFVSPS